MRNLVILPAERVRLARLTHQEAAKPLMRCALRVPPNTENDSARRISWSANAAPCRCSILLNAARRCTVSARAAPIPATSLRNTCFATSMRNHADMSPLTGC